MAAAAAGLLGWLAWGAVLVGISRLVREHGLRSRVPEALDLAVRLTPADPEAHFARAWLLTGANDLERATRAYEQAINLRPRYFVLWLELGKVRDQAGDAEGALEAFREAARLAPFYAQPHWQLGNVLLRAGQREEAIAELRRAVDSDPTLYPNLLQTVWYAMNGDAAAVADAAHPRTRGELFILTKFLIKQGEIKGAMSFYSEIGGDLAEEERASLLKELLDAGSYDEAFEVWARGWDSSKRDGFADGGFEGALRADEVGFGWQFAKAQTGGAVKLSLDIAGPREGAHSLRADFNGNSPPGAKVISQLVLVEPSSRYRLTFSARTRDLVTGGLPFVRVSAAGEKGTESLLAESQPFDPRTTEAWRDYAVEFTTGESVRAVRISLQRRDCPSPCPAFGHVWLDAFGLSKL